MRKIVSICLCIALLFTCTTAFAYEIDLSLLTYDQLAALKLDVENEMLLRLDSRAGTVLYGQTNAKAVNARKEASDKSSRVIQLQRGTAFIILGTEENTSNEAWYKIEIDGEIVYVRKELVDEIDETTALSLINDEKAAETKSSSISSSSSTSSGTKVWISKTGSRYHRINNCGNMNPDKAKRISLEDAKKKYAPCKKCY